MRAIITSCAGATFGSDLRFSALVQQAKGVGRRAKRNTGFVPRAACACACPSAGGAYKYFGRLSRLPFPTWFSGMYSCIKEQTFFFFASGNPLGALCGASCPLPFALCPLQATRLSVSVAYIRTRYQVFIIKLYSLCFAIGLCVFPGVSFRSAIIGACPGTTNSSGDELI